MTPRRFALPALVAAGLVGGGCLEALAPDVGPARDGQECAIPDSDPGTTIQFGIDIRDGVFDRCTTCHLPDGGDPIGISVGGLDLSTYATLRLGGLTSGPEIVIPADPCTSVLLRKLSSNPPFGAQMPLDRRPLSTADLDVISDWIVEGALDN